MAFAVTSPGRARVAVGIGLLVLAWVIGLSLVGRMVVCSPRDPTEPLAKRKRRSALTVQGDPWAKNNGELYVGNVVAPQWCNRPEARCGVFRTLA